MDEILKNSKENLGISDFLKISKEYVNKNFKEIDLENFFDKTLSGEFDFNNLKLDIFDVLGVEILEVVKILISILIIIIIHSIFKIIIQSLENSSSTKIAEFIQYLVIVSIIINSNFLYLPLNSIYQYRILDSPQRKSASVFSSSKCP